MVQGIHDSKMRPVDYDVDLYFAPTEICLNRSIVNVLHQTMCSVPRSTNALQKNAKLVTFGQKSNSLYSHYIISNCTNESFRFGQKGSDEAWHLAAKSQCAYNWFTKGQERLLRVWFEGEHVWDESITMDKDGTYSKVLSYKGRKTTVWFKVEVREMVS